MAVIYIIYSICGIAGAIIPYYLQRRFNWDAVTASALPSLFFALLLKLLFLSNDLETEMAFIFFGASFVGMVSKNILPNYFQVALSGILFCVLYLHASTFFQGYGGGLGTAACISVLILYGIKKFAALRYFFQKRKR